MTCHHYPLSTRYDRQTDRYTYRTLKLESYRFWNAFCTSQLNLEKPRQVTSSKILHKWNRKSLNLINHWSINGINLKILFLTCVLLNYSILVSNTRGGRFRPFAVMEKYFCQWIQEIQWKHKGKTELYLTIVWYVHNMLPSGDEYFHSNLGIGKSNVVTFQLLEVYNSRPLQRTLVKYLFPV